MKLFIASHSRDAARSLMDGLQKRGHDIVARWITADTKFELGIASYTDQERRRIAELDEEDVRAAIDGVIVIAESTGQNVPGGKHVESGIALGLGRPVFVLGRRENIFHWHPRVFVFPDEESLFSHLEQT